MSAETTVYVKVTKEVEQWIEVEALTCYAAIEMVKNYDGVVNVIGAQYDEPEEND